MSVELESYVAFLETRGVTRRTFLKFCGGIAATIGLSASGTFRVAEALAQNAQRPSVIWLNFASDSGCTESLIKATYPRAAELILDTISLDYNETIMAPAGEQAEDIRREALEKGDYILVVEGGVPTKDGYGTIADKNMFEILEEMAEKATAIIAVGSCATFGGVPSMRPNPAAIKGVQEHLSEEFSVINLDLCPVNPRNLAATIVSVIVLGEIPETDRFGRPLMFHSQTIHDNCERRAHFDAGRFVQQLGDDNEAKGHCLYKMGCKGPMTFSNCSKARFDDRVSWCIGAGGPCIGCAEPGWPDKFAGFYTRLPEVGIPGIEGVETTADNIGLGLGIAAVVGIGAHAVASAASGRGRHGEKDGEE